MAWATVNGLRLCYEIKGQGPRLLHVNITGGDLRLRPNIFDSPLAGRFTILSHDQRGLGQSDKPDQPYAMADYADDAAALLDHVGWSDAHVLGVSFGGMVAQELALRHAKRVGRLVLACTTSGGAGGASYPLHELASLSLEERVRRLTALADLRRDPAWQRANPQAWQAEVERGLTAQGAFMDEPGRAIGRQRQLEARQGHDTWDRLPSLALPTLVCGGLFDGIAPPERLLNLARQIPGARLELFQGGHYFLAQDPRAWARVGEFLAE